MIDVHARRVKAEVGRILGRRGPILSVAAVALLAGGFAAGAAAEMRRVDFLSFAFCFLPVFLLPFGARMAGRDLERGLTAVLATASTSAGERLVAQVVAMTLMTIAWIAAAIPAWAILFEPAAEIWSSRALNPLVWGLLIGLSSGFTGLLVGWLAGPRATLGLTAGFVLAFVWILLPANATTLIALVGPAWQKRLVMDLVHLSPVMWGLDALGFFWIAPAANSPPLLLAGLLFVLAPLVALSSVVLGARHVAVWHLTRRGTGTVGLALIIVVATVAGLASWPFPTERPVDRVTADEAEGDGYRVEASIDWESMVRGRRDLSEGERLPFRLSFVGQANRSLQVTDVRVTSEQVTFQRVGAPPGVVVLDEIQPSHGDDGPVGQKQVVSEFVVTPRYVDGSLLALSVAVEVDGTIHRLGVWVFPSIPVSLSGLAAATGTVAFGAAALGLYLPWRWNRW